VVTARRRADASLHRDRCNDQSDDGSSWWTLPSGGDGGERLPGLLSLGEVVAEVRATDHRYQLLGRRIWEPSRPVTTLGN
jgi:hypothetical protein